MSSKLWTVGLATALACATAAAQPGPRDHHVVITVGPTAPPPPLQAEEHAARAGFEWIPGRWDWRGHKWEWQPGRWEKEHAGQHWHQGKWEQHGPNWAWVEGTWGAGEAVTVTVGPTAPPPPPQAENHPGRAGFEWVPGRWDWQGGKWQWMAGRWEKEHPGQHWHQGKWEQRGPNWAWVEGEWGAGEGNSPVGPPPPPPGDGAPHEHHEWKVDRPTVSSYWPTKGKVGKHVVVRGRNFPNDVQVVWNANPIAGAKVSPDEILFEVPAGAASGLIALRHGHGRDLPVGTFEIVTTGDPDADAKRIEDDRRKRAEAAWSLQQQSLAKDKAAREAAWQQRQAELESTREQRRQAREAELRAKWDAAFLGDPDTQSELTMHAERVAQLARALDVAQVAENGKLVVRIQVAQSRENDRHDQRMAALKTSFATKGPNP